MGSMLGFEVGGWGLRAWGLRFGIDGLEFSVYHVGRECSKLATTTQGKHVARLLKQRPRYIVHGRV